MSKKLTSAVLSVLLIALCLVPAFASGSSMQISTNTETDYQLAFPADFEIPWETDTITIGAVSATKMLIEPAMAVKVSVASANGFTLKNTANAQNTITYTLSGADSIEFLAGDFGKAFPLSVTVAQAQWEKAASGEYRDTLTFTVEYTEKS